MLRLATRLWVRPTMRSIIRQSQDKSPDSPGVDAGIDGIPATDGWAFVRVMRFTQVHSAGIGQQQLQQTHKQTDKQTKSIG